MCTDSKMDLSAVTEAECEPCLPVGEGQRAKVVRVIDGDSLIVAFERDGRFVRMALRVQGIDCPELHSRNVYEKRMALAAKNRLRDAVEGRVVTLFNIGVEKFGRILSDLCVPEGPGSVSHYMLQAPSMCHAYKGEAKQSWTFTADDIANAPELPVSPRRSMTNPTFL